MKSVKMFVGIFAVCLCLMSFGLVAADADADGGVTFGTESVTFSGFTDMDDGTLKAYVSNSDVDNAYTVKLVVKDYVSNGVEASATKEIPAGAQNVEISVSFGYGSDGTEYVKVYLYDGADKLLDSCGPYEITVKHSIWKDWVTYLVVVIIIIVIIILAYFYIRGAPDRAARKAAAIQGNTKSAPAGRTKYDAGSGRKAKRK